MRKLLVMSALAVLVCADSRAQELAGVNASDVRGAGIKPPAVSNNVNLGGDQTVIKELHLLARTDQSRLFTRVKTEAEFEEFSAIWEGTLAATGIKVVEKTYQNGLGQIKYATADGRVIRSFLAERVNYNALDTAGMEKLCEELIGSLKSSGLTPLVSFNIDNEALRPTFVIYYLTEPKENSAREMQLRQLTNADGIDFELLDNAVTTVKRDGPYSFLYIGKLVGLKSKICADEAAVAAKVSAYREFLNAENKEYIGHKAYKLEVPPVVEGARFDWSVDIYFFQ